MNDLHLAIQTVQKLKIPFGVVINRAEPDDLRTRLHFKAHDLPILLKVPFDRKIAELYSAGIPFVEQLPGYRGKFLDLFRLVRETSKVLT
jgi:MinD superfamily P-loop ATPase